MTLFYIIEEKQSRRGRWVRCGASYSTREEAEEMIAMLEEHGGCGPLRIVEVRL